MSPAASHPPGSYPESPIDLVRRVRHLLVSLRMSGVETIHAPERTARQAFAEKAEESPDAANQLQEIRQNLGDCRRCRLHEGRSHIVFGDGSARAPVVFVGEGPGADEDKIGKPFVGRAGKLLDKMIIAMGFARSDVYICNVVKCRPPRNRNPEGTEIETCSPFLFRQLEAIRPKVICTLGAVATHTLLDKHDSISKLRKSSHYWRGIPVVPTYHPAYLLRSPAQKAATWQDLLEVLQWLD